MTSGADLLCRTLEQHGVDCAFGVPGTQSLPLHEALRRSRIRVVTATHELAASFMANGYYRSCGRIAALVTIPGPGFTYALTGLAEALHDSAAVLHIVGRAPGTDPQEHFQALDQAAIARPLVKRTFRADTAEEIPAVVSEALGCALSGEPGPVLVEWTAEALESSARAVATPCAVPVRNVDGSALDAAARRLATARRPLILAGQGCAGAPGPLQELAERLLAPVLTTASGRGVLAEDHPLALGYDFARADAESVNELLGAADVVLAIGCKLGAAGTGGFRLRLPRERLIRVDPSANALRTTHPALLEILATAEVFLAEVVPEVVRRRASDQPSWSRSDITAWRRRVRGGPGERVPAVAVAGATTAAAFFAELRAALPREAIVVADSGMHQTLLRRHFDVLAPRGLLLPSDFQSMGFGLPASIGASIASPGRPVVAVLGDGGFAMSGMEILTAVRERIPLTVIVFADRKLNRIRMDQLARYGHAAAVEVRNPEFATFAKALGIRHVRCDGNPGAVLPQSIPAAEPTLVEVPVEDTGAVRLLRLRGLARGTARRAVGPGFVQGARRLFGSRGRR